MLVIDPHRATPCIPLTVGDPDRADDDLARLANASPIPDPVPVTAFEYDKALRLKEFAIRRLGRRAKNQALAGLRALDHGPDPDHGPAYRRSIERTSALPMTIGWLSASAILPARELGSRATPTCDSGVPMSK